MYSEIWRMFSQSSAHVQALKPCATLPGELAKSSLQILLYSSFLLLEGELSRTLTHNPCVPPRNLAVAALESSDKRISAPTLPQDGGKE